MKSSRLLTAMEFLDEAATVRVMGREGSIKRNSPPWCVGCGRVEEPTERIVNMRTQRVYISRVCDGETKPQWRF